MIICGCASGPQSIVVISPRYNPAEIQRVALMSFDDFPGMIGSGEVTASIFEKYLLLAGYGVIERRQVSEVMKEQAFQATGVIDQATLQKIGQLLGVNALIFGTINDFRNPGEHTVMVDIPQTQSSPILGDMTTTKRSKGTSVTTSQQVVTGYTYSTSDQVLPQVEAIPAHVGLSVRLVDVETGEVLWSASGISDGTFLNDATEKASAQIMQDVTKKLQKIK